MNELDVIERAELDDGLSGSRLGRVLDRRRKIDSSAGSESVLTGSRLGRVLAARDKKRVEPGLDFEQFPERVDPLDLEPALDKGQGVEKIDEDGKIAFVRMLQNRFSRLEQLTTEPYDAVDFKPSDEDLQEMQDISEILKRSDVDDRGDFAKTAFRGVGHSFSKMARFIPGALEAIPGSGQIFERLPGAKGKIEDFSKRHSKEIELNTIKKLPVRPPSGKFARDTESVSDFFNLEKLAYLAAVNSGQIALFMATNYLNPVVGTIAMGAVEGGDFLQGVDDYEKKTGKKLGDAVKNRGALLVGVLNGAMERIGFDSILKAIKSSGLRKKIIHNLVSVATEGSTEGFQGLVQLFAKEAYGGDKVEADKALKQFVQEFQGGMAMALGTSSPGMATEITSSVYGRLNRVKGKPTQTEGLDIKTQDKLQKDRALQEVPVPELPVEGAAESEEKQGVESNSKDVSQTSNEEINGKTVQKPTETVANGLIAKIKAVQSRPDLDLLRDEMNRAISDGRIGLNEAAVVNSFVAEMGQKLTKAENEERRAKGEERGAEKLVRGKAKSEGRRGNAPRVQTKTKFSGEDSELDAVVKAGIAIRDEDFFKGRLRQEMKDLRNRLGPNAFNKNGKGLEEHATDLGISEDELRQRLMGRKTRKEKQADRDVEQLFLENAKREAEAAEAERDAEGNVTTETIKTPTEPPNFVEADDERVTTAELSALEREDAKKEKEPWEMTFKEYRDFKRKDSGGVVVGEDHAKLIKKAIESGKPVPAEVLKDYPNINDINEQGNKLTKFEPTGVKGERLQGKIDLGDQRTVPRGKIKTDPFKTKGTLFEEKEPSEKDLGQENLFEEKKGERGKAHRLHILKTPNGKFMFVGRVPDELAFEEGATQEDIQKGKRFGERFGPKPRIFDTEDDAVEFAAEKGFDVKRTSSKVKDTEQTTETEVEELEGVSDEKEQSTTTDADVLPDSGELEGEPAKDVSINAERQKPSPVSVREGAGSDTGESDDTGADAGSGLREEAGGGELPEGSEAGGGDSASGTGVDIGVDSVPQRGGAASVGRDFRITAATKLGVGGKRAKFNANLAAIKTLKKIEDEGREATPEEQAILVKYVGWGGLSEEAFTTLEHKHSEYAGDRKKLRELLTEEEFNAAVASTTNAHYTAPRIVSAIYSALDHFGFKGGRLLEPGSGIGNFVGLLPDSFYGKTTFTAIERDKVSGRILRKLYPSADLRLQPYEDTKIPDNFYDGMVGNVPFADVKIHDPELFQRYGQKFSVHNYFILKSLKKVRPGGVMAFITSRFTMDSKESSFRDIVAKDADFLGAIRLPRETFQENAKTEVVTDIIFLQKRAAGAKGGGETWSGTKAIKSADGDILVNEYFAKNKSMMIGTASLKGSMYGNLEPTWSLADKASIPVQVVKKIARMTENIYKSAEVVTKPDVATDRVKGKQSDKQGGFKKLDGGRVGVVEGTNITTDTAGNTVYEPEVRVLSDVPRKAKARIESFIGLRDATNAVFDAQLERKSEAEKAAARKQLGVEYDRFVKKHGFLNAPPNRATLESDPDSYVVMALEDYNPKTKKGTKRSIFTEDTIVPEKVFEEASKASDALTISLAQTGRVDLAEMAKLTGKSVGEVQGELKGVVFNAPGEGWQTAEEYLSGDVRQKLEDAKAAVKTDKAFRDNVAALEKVQPRDLDASEVRPRIGAAWISGDVVTEFAKHIGAGSGTKVTKLGALGTWRVKGSSFGGDSTLLREKFGTRDKSALELLDDALNLRTTKVTFKDRDGRTFTDKAKTQEAQSKVKEIKAEFANWVFADAARRTKILAHYNKTQNNIRLRKYDGSHLTFEGMNKNISLRKNQIDGIWRILTGGNTVLAHKVGAGKTFTMIAAGMEARRMGLFKKPLYVVRKHMLTQFRDDFLELYPNAKILVASEKNFITKNRKRFMAQIATGDWDGIIITHPSLKFVPMAKETEIELIREQIDEMVAAEFEMADVEGKGSPTVKSLARKREALEQRIAKMLDTKRDDAVTFEQLGVDMMMVDESQNFKNLAYSTKMSQVLGLGKPAGGVQTFDLYTKTRYLIKANGGEKGVVFSTGTPLSNSMSEMYLLKKYLIPLTLKRLGLSHFDAWASTYGEVTNAVEKVTTGKYEPRARFTKFVNVPELLMLFRSFTDVVMEDNLPQEILDARPKIVSGEAKAVLVDSSPELAEYLKGIIKRAEAITGRPEKGKDNHLSVQTDARKASLDMRLVNIPTSSEQKVDVQAENIFQIWTRTSKEKSTQLVFADKSAPYTGKWNIYEETKKLLVGKGIPAEQIKFIHDAKTDKAKVKLFAAVNAGEVRVLIGSTQKLGEGTNVQHKLIALHEIDPPDRPSDIEQRVGRIVRQGNENREVNLFRYATAQSFDENMWQRLEQKAKWIAQALAGDLTTREIEDISDVFAESAAEMKAIVSGDPRIKEMVTLENELRELESSKSGYNKALYSMQDKITGHPGKIAAKEKSIAGLRADDALYTKETKGLKPEDFSLVLNGKTFTKRKDAGKAVMKAAAKHERFTGTYKGFKLEIIPEDDAGTIGSFISESVAKIRITGQGVYESRVSQSDIGTITALENRLKAIPSDLRHLVEQEKALKSALTTARAEIDKPWQHEVEFKTKTERLAEILKELAAENQRGNIEGGDDVSFGAEAENNENIVADMPDSVYISAKNRLNDEFRIKKPTGSFKTGLKGEGTAEYASVREHDAKSGIAPTPTPDIQRAENIRGGFLAGRPITPRRFSSLSRIFTKEQTLSLTSRSHKINNAADAAFLFRALEHEAVEHVFWVHVLEDGTFHVQHAGIGSVASAVVQSTDILAPVKALKTKKLYFVHNHPSGNLEASEADVKRFKVLKAALNNVGVNLNDGIIINLNKGEYATFNGGSAQIHKGRPIASGNEFPVDIFNFNRRVFFDGFKEVVINTPHDVAQYLSQFRHGIGDKIGALIMASNGTIVGNFPLVQTDINKAATHAEVLASLLGGSSIVLYGNKDVGKIDLETLTRGDINVVDYIHVSTDNLTSKEVMFWSTDEGGRRVGEKQVPYKVVAAKTEVRDSGVVSEKKFKDWKYAGRRGFDLTEEDVGKKLNNWKVRLSETVANSQERVKAMQDLKDAKLKGFGRDPFESEVRFHGRVGTRLERAQRIMVDITRKEVEFEARKDKDFPEHKERDFITDVSRYLVATHAPDVNTALKKKAAAGITTEQAFKIAEEIEALPYFNDVNQMAKWIRELNEQTLLMLVDAEVISQDLFDALKERYPNHVPLNRVIPDLDDSEMSDWLTAGAGLSVQGTGLHRIKGSELEIDDILTNVGAAVQEAIVRAEKNRVLLTVWDFARENKALGLFQEQRKGKELLPIGTDSEGNPVWDTARLLQDKNIMGVRVKGKQEFLFIADPGLAQAIKLGNKEEIGTLTRIVRPVTKYVTATATRFNPAFPPVNLFLDTQEMVVFMMAQEGFGIRGALGTMRFIPESMKDVASVVWGKGDTPGAKLYKQMQADGGTTGGIAVSTKEQVRIDVEKLRKTARSKPRQVQQQLVKFFDDYNAIFEDANRLSIYKNALERGKTRREAAILAKEATINFNRKGTIGAGLNAWYAFSNVSIQGSIKMFNVLKNPKVAGTIVSTMAFAVLAETLWNDMMCDDWRDKVPSWDRDKNLVIITRPCEKGRPLDRLLIPISWGLKPIKVILNHVTDIGFGRDVGTAAQVTARLTASAMDAYNPVGGSTLIQGLAPTIVDVPVDVYTNTTWFDKPVFPDWGNYKEASDHKKHFRSLRDEPLGKFLITTTEALNDNVGVSISPQVVKYNIEQYAGGVGRTALRAWSTISDVGAGKIPDAGQIPVVNRFFRSTPTEVVDGWQKRSRMESADFKMAKEATANENVDRNNRIRDAFEQYVDADPATQTQILYDLVNSDPRAFKSLKRRLRDHERGIGYYESSLKDIPPERRARVIFEELKRSKERDERYNELVEARVINGEVDFYLRQLEGKRVAKGVARGTESVVR